MWVQDLWEWFQANGHAPVYILLFAYAGQISKRFVFTPEHISAWATLRDQLWNAGGAKRVPGALLKLLLAIPLPLHPWFAAIVLALPTALPLPAGVDNDLWHRELVMQTCAILSLGFYDIAHKLLGRQGLDFKFPGEGPRRPSQKQYIENMPVGGYSDDGNDDLG